MSAAALSPTGNGLWLRSKAWDLTWISGSVLLMTLPYASYYAGRAVGLDPDYARNAVNMLVAFFIGGPHMYATHIRTTLDPTFRKQHHSIYLAALLIPAVVIYLGYFHFVLLLTFFFIWASLHVLHQIIYLVDCYNGRVSSTTNIKARIIDYVLVLTALYPIAFYRWVHHDFTVGHNTLYCPPFLQHEWVWILESAIFTAALTLFITKTFREFKTGEGNIPKTILISVTVIAAFVTPIFRELDVAFQGMNTWHSFQYLGLTWYITRLRYDRGQLPRRTSIFGRPGQWWRFYGFNVILNSTALILIGALIVTRNYTHLTFDQCYYMVVLCFLLTHYYHDHFVFAEKVQFATSPERTPQLAMS